MKLRIKLSSVDVRLLDSAVKSIISDTESLISGLIAIPLPTRESMYKRVIEIRGASMEVINTLTNLYISQSVHIVIL